MIHTYELQQGRMQIMNMDWFLDGFKTEFIGRTVSHATFDTATG